VSELIETLVLELERPRELSAQVAKHLSRTYDVELESIGEFLARDLPNLEDYEHDLILSPLFTPKLAEQAIFAEILNGTSVPRDEWPGLVQQLAARPTRAHLLTADGQMNLIVLREVTIERYVYRLRLDGTIPESLLRLLDQPILKAIARRSIWDSEARRGILELYLTSTSGQYILADAIGLLELVENYKPSAVTDLVERIIPHLQEVLRHEINMSSGSKPFFSQRIHDEHGGDRDQRRRDDARIASRQNELAFLDRLQAILAG
jgi:hypothetical protein